MTKDDRPTLAYVIGTSDCGSTLLAFVLDCHPLICAVGEPPKRAIRRRGASFQCSCGSFVEECQFWRDLFESLRAKGLDFTHTSWPNDFHYFNDYADRLLARHQHTTLRRAAQRVVANLLPPHRHRLRHVKQSSVEFVREVLAQTHKAVFLDTTKELFRFGQLSAEPAWNMKVIRMVRDVRWFAYAKHGRLSAIDAARHWRAYQIEADRLLAKVPSENQILVRYEDLCNHPAASARRVHSFLNLLECDPPSEFDPAMHHILGDGIGGRFTISTLERWRDGLSKTDLDASIAIAGDINRRFGYT